MSEKLIKTMNRMKRIFQMEDFVMAGEKGLRKFSVYSCGNGFLGDLDLYAF